MQDKEGRLEKSYENSSISDNLKEIIIELKVGAAKVEGFKSYAKRITIF